MSILQFLSALLEYKLNLGRILVADCAKQHNITENKAVVIFNLCNPLFFLKFYMWFIAPNNQLDFH